ncbi:MAG TPA: dicarboxylate/amino acid:cation symporter [Candidatus Xenobia bacterium]
MTQASPSFGPRRLSLQVLMAIALGVLIGWLDPGLGVQLKPLADGFIRLIRMLIGPIIFTTVTVGIGKMSNLRDVGRIGLKALVYFEAVTLLALVIGLIVANVYRPGEGLNVDAKTLDTSAVASYAQDAKKMGAVDFLLDMIPESVVDAFAKGNILQVLLFSVLLGIVLSHLGEKTAQLVHLIDMFGQALFGIVGVIMWVAPLGAGGAMAFTVGKYGVGALQQLAWLMGGVYLTCLLFIFVVLGLIARWTGFSLWRFLVYIREEIAIVVGTSSSESVLPLMMAKLERLGCAESVVGLVIPTGYSFNLDGTSIYLTMAVLFIAQATNTPLSLTQQLAILGVLLLTSKGAAAVTGGGFITLAATLSSTGALPVAGLALLLGVDRFMSEARALTNLIGNGVATLVVARWEKALDMDRLRQELRL